MWKTINALSVALVLYVSAVASVPQLIEYQGRLTTPAGANVADGSYSVVFTIYDAASGGTSLWAETRAITTSAGLFAVQLGATSPLADSIFRGSTRYLGIKVGSDAEMTPRVALVAVPWALRVATVDSASGGTISGDVQVSGLRSAFGNYVSGLDAFGTRLHIGSAPPNDFASIFLGHDADNHVWIGYTSTVPAGFIDTKALPLVLQSLGGSVGIGTWYPATKLHVSGGGEQRITLSSSSGAALQLIADNNSAGWLRTSTNHPLYFSVNSSVSPKVTLETSGLMAIAGGNWNVAGSDGDLRIGDASYRLKFGVAVAGGGAGHCRIYAAGGIQTLTLGSGSSDVLTVVNDKVGIGVLSPTHILDVNGGAYCSGTTWTNASDRNLKENFTPIDAPSLLHKVATLPISEWNYRSDGASVKHIGPTAQDFKAIFGVGNDSTSISTIDPAGIALAAMKELIRQNEELKTQLQALSAEVNALKHK